MKRLAIVLAVMLVAGGALAGGKKPKQEKRPPHAPEAPAVDSVTVALWRLDENGGPLVEDSGPFRLNGTAGPDTRTDFGRFRSARVFTRTQQSFVVVPYTPALDVERGFTIEAWIEPASWSNYELSVVAARWSPLPGEQSWVLGVSGLKQTPPAGVLAPSVFQQAMTDVPAARVVFVMQPAQAAGAVAYATASSIDLDRWVHVAVTVNGEAVRLYLDGRLDAQYATRQTLRASVAPLVFGSYVDEHRLSELSGQLELENSDYSGYYGFDGVIDEVRLSNAARTGFESLDSR